MVVRNNKHEFPGGDGTGPLITIYLALSPFGFILD